ncbi:MAG: hypothetical protein H8E13_12235 [Actinobacteria bacterium]|nr:hypothetical protein [Actinomycetota bacterium]
MKKFELRKLIKEEYQKLNEVSKLSLKDDILSGITLEELIQTIESNEKIYNERAIKKVFEEILKIKIEDAKYVLKQNIAIIKKVLNK